MKEYNFKKHKFTIVKKAISSELADFLGDYLVIKRNAADLLFRGKHISPFEEVFGHWNDDQVRGTYSIYGDVAMDNLLLKLQDKMEEICKIKLLPTYAYARIYKQGDELLRHKDRASCSISTTLNLGGDPWPIYLSPDKNVGIPNNKDITCSSDAKGFRIDLKKGDMLVYSGCELEHWRERFTGAECGQVFLHYTESTEENQKYIFDGRLALGLPKYVTNDKK
jgi:hypothetical protein